jgi:hypothetical protein
MKTMNRASAVLLILALLSLESPGAWWVPVLCAAAAALAALFVSSSRLGYLGTGAGARRSAGLPPRLRAPGQADAGLRERFDTVGGPGGLREDRYLIRAQ